MHGNIWSLNSDNSRSKSEITLEDFYKQFLTQIKFIDQNN